jgi:hypothetical protein
MIEFPWDRKKNPSRASRGFGRYGLLIQLRVLLAIPAVRRQFFFFFRPNENKPISCGFHGEPKS